MRVTGAVVVIALGVAGAVVVPATIQAPASASGPAIEDVVAQGPIPVVGAGPLVRLVRTVPTGGSTLLLDAYGGRLVGEVRGSEAAQAGALYVLQRYGYSPGLTRSISLTFDDGPDPRFTPQLLDLLSRERVPATFFVIGSTAVRHPELVDRARREGHVVAAHSLTHADLSTTSDWRSRAEFVWPQRILRSTASTSPPLMRLPYEGDDEESTREALVGVMRAQRLGFAVASHDFDTDDWESPRAGDRDRLQLPPLDGRNLTVLMHDGGGDRSETLGYVAGLIRAARAHGYQFTTMATAQAGHLPAQPAHAVASGWDKVTTHLATAIFDWPGHVMRLLLVLAAFSVLTGVVNGAIATVRHLRRRRYPPGPVDQLPVSVVIAAYNEERVIERTIRSVLTSDHPLREVLVVDDGSVDGTAAVLAALAGEDERVRVITQANRGKAAALNHALEHVRSDLVVTMDADTLMTPQTVGRLVRHFAADDDGRLAAVASVIRVGNRTRNMLTRWQALEYVTQIGVERAAQDALGAVAVVPGACAAWRAEAIRSVGGYSDDTLAEDNDLTLALQEARWRIVQDDDAVAYTEAPEDVDSLLAQRTRWMYGTLQSIWKHRGLLFGRNGWLGWVVLPTYVASILLPLLFLPLTTLMAVLMVRQQGWTMLLWCALAFIAAQAVTSAVAVLVLGERLTLLAVVPAYRIVIEPLRAYLLYTSAFMALRGVRARWNKFARTGTVLGGRP